MGHKSKTVVGNSLVERESVPFLIIKLRLRALTHHQISHIAECFPLPRLRHAVDNFNMFMAGEAEADKPFFVKLGTPINPGAIGPGDDSMRLTAGGGRCVRRDCLGYRIS